MKNIVLLLCFLLCLCACGDKAPKPFALEGLYEFTQGYADEQEPLNCFLNIEKNGKYTMFVPDYFDYGHWEREADTNTIVFYSNRSAAYYGPVFSMHINSYDYTSSRVMASYSFAKQVEKNYGDGRLNFDQVKVGVKTELVLVRDSVQYPDSLNPYTFNLNRWRLKATDPESCREVSYRTINYLKHMYALFYGQYRYGASHYNYSYSPSPLLFGQNGIATITFDNIPSYWIGTFYDEQQAKQSAEMISSLFDEDLKMPKGYKRYDEMWSNILKQMLDIALKKDFCNTVTIKDTAQAR